MSLDDLRNGRGQIIAGAFNKRPTSNIPIIGQKKEPDLFWQQIGLVSVTEPILGVEGAPEQPNYVVTVGGVRSDGQMVVSAIALSPDLVKLGPKAIVEEMGMALNMLHTYRNCSCPTGERCAFHTPPKDDKTGEDGPKDEPKVSLS